MGGPIVSEVPDFDGYSFVGFEEFAIGPASEIVAIYQSEAFAQALRLADDERDVRAEFVLIPSGTVRLGIDEEELERLAKVDEDTAHELECSLGAHDVAVDEFLFARTTLTQQVWDGLAAQLDVELWDQRVSESPYLPVHGLTWTYFDETAPELGLRLPSEAEWEYAARGPSPGPFPWGKSKGTAFEFAWYGHPHEGGPMGVAQKRPNGFGLYDISGNVWELCGDYWHECFGPDAPADGSAWLGDDDPWQRVMRGGSFRSQSATALLLCYRSSAGRHFSGDDMGVRPVAIT